MAANGISRRSLLAAAPLGGALAALPQAAPAVAAAAGGRSPNFLWFFSEDNHPHVGAHGEPVVSTPHMDRLAAEGVRFDIAYSAAPVCAPSRFAFVTGLYPETAGPAHHMRCGPGQSDSTGTAVLPASFRAFPEYLRRAGYYTTNNFKTDYNMVLDMAATWDDSSRTAHWRNRPTSRTPFFATFTTVVNHESSLFEVTDGPTDPATVHVPAYLPDTPEMRRQIAHSHNRQILADQELGRVLAELEADGLADDTIVIFSGDNGGALPNTKRYVNDHGLHIPLIIKVPPRWRHLVSEEPGTVLDTPVNGVDLAPTILALADLRVPGHMQGDQLLGRRPRGRREYSFGGRGRMDERYDIQRAVRDRRFLYVRNYMPHRPLGQFVAYGWQQPGYQMWEQAHLEGNLNAVQDRFWEKKVYEELYDLSDDPDQTRNLAEDRRHTSTLNRLRAELDRHMLEINDNGLIPELHPAEGYEASRAPGAYPLRRVMEIAEIAARRDPAHLDRLIDTLGHEVDLLRYWAATGLLILGEHAAAVSDTLAAALAAESSVWVKIPLAEALARLGHTYHSVKFLAETVDTHPVPEVRLQAINALTYVGAAALPYKSVIDRAAGSSYVYLRNAGRYLKLELEGVRTPTTPVFAGSA
ncbi:hypothetical protein CJD44_00780 [Streptomyces sp. alain-838]|nr:hypothetical protein CJD44_00780 [Streptomyces sp. alain-838]